MSEDTKRKEDPGRKEGPEREPAVTRVEGDTTQPGHVIAAKKKAGEDGATLTYTAEKVVGNGSFGVVFKCRCEETGEAVAMKRVLQDKRYKNRELSVMQSLDHPNVVALKHYFYDTNSQGETYLHLILDFVPGTVYQVNKECAGTGQGSSMPLPLCRVYSLQLLRSLSYIHSKGICHRDIKPQNLLVTEDNQVKLCDFGSAKVLGGEPNISYICSRYYRAPELILGATEYTTAIDIWSAGCVIGELLIGHPLFPGESGIDQLVEIIKVLGTPSRADISAMNTECTDYKLPNIRGNPWNKVFNASTNPDAANLLAQLLTYSPAKRITASSACSHEFFQPLYGPDPPLPSPSPALHVLKPF